MNKILDVMEDIKQNITDKEYKTIMDSLMEIHKTNNNSNLLPVLSVNQKLNKFASLFNWLDRKLELTESQNDRINRRDLYKYIKVNYFNCSYNTTCGFIKNAYKHLFYVFRKKDKQIIHILSMLNTEIKNIYSSSSSSIHSFKFLS